MIITHPNGNRRSEPVVLGFDTSLPHCDAALFHDADFNNLTEPMKRGQGERLMPLLEELLASEGLTWKDIELIAVGIGPGNFTGIRIAVAAARGLGLGLGIPVLGVSSFEAMLDPDGQSAGPSIMMSLPAPRDHAYVQHFRYGKPTSPPVDYDLENLPDDLQFPINTEVIGYEAEKLCLAGHASSWEARDLQKVAARIARRGYVLFNYERDWMPERPSPLYIRAADAAPPRDPAPVILP